MGIGYKKDFMKYQSIIFDLDGVICSTDQYHYMAWKQIADDEGIYFDDKINEQLRGISRMQSLEIILERAPRVYTQAEKELLAARKNGIYVKLLDNMTTASVAPDTLNTLKALRLKGIKMAVGSSSKNTKLILSKIGLAEFFDAVADGTMVTHSKPHPEVFIKALDMLGGRPCESRVVEDASAGIEAASKGGFASAGLRDARNHKKVTYKIDRVSDILYVLESA